ncbi:MAG: rhomboid family intramembrane serine protease [Chthoniobacterales bacterium]
MRLKHSRRTGPRKRWTPPTISLTALLTAFFLTCHASQELFFAQTGLGSASAWLALSSDGIRHGYLWQFLTHTLVASSLGQLLASLIPLFLIGRELEPILGPRRLAGAFLLTLLPSSALSLAWPPDNGQMGLWPAVCGWLAILGTMMPLLEFRSRLFRRRLIVRLRVLTCLLPAVLACAILADWIPHCSLITLPPALLIGYLYARWLGYGLPTRLERLHHERRQQQQRWHRLAHRVFIVQEVDPILEKITRQGWKSLTRRERKILRHSADSLRS